MRIIIKIKRCTFVFVSLRAFLFCLFKKQGRDTFKNCIKNYKKIPDLEYIEFSLKGGNYDKKKA